jgi:hypothetical protein
VNGERSLKEKRDTNDGRGTTVVDVYQVAVQVHMLISSDLDSGIGRLGRGGAGREREFGEDSVRRESDQRDRLGCEVCRIGGENLLDGRMRRLNPVGSKRCLHFAGKIEAGCLLSSRIEVDGGVDLAGSIWRGTCSEIRSIWRSWFVFAMDTV